MVWVRGLTRRLEHSAKTIFYQDCFHFFPPFLDENNIFLEVLAFKVCTFLFGQKTEKGARDYKVGFVRAAAPWLTGSAPIGTRFWLVSHPQPSDTHRRRRRDEGSSSEIHLSHLGGGEGEGGVFPPGFLSLMSPYFTSPSPRWAERRPSPRRSPLSAVWLLQMSTRRGL